tara:strand:- start:12823 stop:13566 length:744 start_codon:yes stop_codon:yes gene_type:complete
MKKIKQKNIFITGVGKGIGEDLVYALIKKGYFVFGITRSQKDIKKFKNLKNCKILKGDVRNLSKIDKVFKDSIILKRPITGLVNNAGIRQRKEFNKISKTDLKEVFDVNFFSIFEIMKNYFNYCKKYKLNSSIVNIGSIVGTRGFEGLCGYASSKGALKSLTQSFAVEAAPYNIRANVINPGFIKTSYFKKFKSKKQKLYSWTISRIPQKKWGDPKDVSGLIAYLLSDESNYITGETINIDGGWINS